MASARGKGRDRDEERGKERAQRGRKTSKAKEYWESIVRVFKYSRKPGAKEYSMFLKIVGLALLAVGGIAFVIHLIATLISGVFG